MNSPDKIVIAPGSVSGEIALPGSKSITNRALLLGALAEGPTSLSNHLRSEDTTVMTQALLALGFSIACRGDRLAIGGGGGAIPAERAELNTMNSGTTMRFLTAACALGRGIYTLDGRPRMRERPLAPLLEALKQLGAAVRCLEKEGYPPVEVTADGLQGGECRVGGEISSQFLSALLMISPLAREKVTIRVEGELVSRPYAKMTLEMMKEFGVEAANRDFRVFEVPAGRNYRGRDYFIEGDASSASYFLAAGALTGGKVRVRNLGLDSIQGDAAFIRVLEKMGADWSGGDDWLEVTGKLQKSVRVDLNDMPDMVPTLAVAALFVPGETVIENVANLRYKESDRLAALAAEIGKIGGRARLLPDGIAVAGGDLRGGEIETYDDHRIAMAFSLAGLRVPGIEIKNPGCVGKTLPEYFELLDSLRR